MSQVTIQGPVPADVRDQLHNAVAKYGLDKPTANTVPGVELVVKGPDGPLTAKGTFQRIGLQLVFTVLELGGRALVGKLAKVLGADERPNARGGHLRRRHARKSGAVALPAPADTPEGKLANLITMQMVEEMPDGSYEMKPGLTFKDKAAILAHIGGAKAEGNAAATGGGTRKQVRQAKRTERKSSKAVKKAAKVAVKAAKKAARKR